MKKIARDNQGVALITVVIGVMFCLLLTSTMLRVSLLGLQSRSINNQTSNTFYSAETVLDSMAMNIQNVAAKAWAETPNQNQTSAIAYVKRTYKLLTNEDFPLGNNTDISPDNYDYLNALMANNIIPGGTITSIGAIERFSGTTGLEGFTIKDIEVHYEDPKTGMVSNVKTDLTVRAPLYKTIESNGYSMVAGGGMTVTGGNSQASTMRLYGGSYSGYKVNSYGNVTRADSSNAYKAALSVTLSNQANMFYMGDLVLNGDLYISGNSRVAFLGDNVEIRGSIFLSNDSKLFIRSGCKLSCRAIYVNQSFDNNGKPTNTNDATKLIDGGVRGSYSNQNDTATYNHLPYANKDTRPQGFNGQGDAFDTTFNNKGPIFVCTAISNDIPSNLSNVDNACTVKSIKVTNGSLQSVSGMSIQVTFKHDAEPVQNKVRTGFSYPVDVEYLKLVDVNYINAVASLGENYPDGKVATVLSTKESVGYTAWDDTSKTDLKVVPSAVTSGSVSRHTVMEGYQGDSNTVQLMIGKADTVLNSHATVAIVKDTLVLNDLNRSRPYTGIFIAPEVIVASAKEGTSYILPLSNAPGVTDSQYKAFIDKIGTGYMKKSDENTAGTKPYVINNLIIGGISTLYNSSSGGGNYTANLEFNSGIDLVEFKNYEKK
ncbi:MAG: hypothetical protein IKI01_06050 [Lachnospiraceae bacterium]|nr:hypothetical protein [Lachnospiraceae bacterium]